MVYNTVVSFRCIVNEPVIRILISPLLFRFFSHINYYRSFRRAPCAAEQVLTSCLFIYSSVYVSPTSQFIPGSYPLLVALSY